MCIHMCTCVHVYIYKFKQVLSHTHAHTHTHTRTWMCVYIFIHTHIHGCVCARAHVCKNAKLYFFWNLAYTKLVLLCLLTPPVYSHSLASFPALSPHTLFCAYLIPVCYLKGTLLRKRSSPWGKTNTSQKDPCVQNKPLLKSPSKSSLSRICR